MPILWFLLAVAGGYLLLLLVAALLVDPRKEQQTHSRFYRRLLNSATAIAVRLCRLKLHTSGLEKLPEGKRLLFVGNHRSNFDPIITWYALKERDIAFISKPENFRIPIFGRLIRKCCFLPIDREDPRKAIETIRKAGELLCSGQVSVGVYPEGTRSLDGTLLPFHNGVFKIARKAEAPIVVLAVRGTEQIHKNFPIRKTHIYLDVLDVIPAAEAAGNTAVTGRRVRELLKNYLQTEV